MAFVQDWDVALNNSADTSETLTGPATTPGNVVFYDLYIREGDAEPVVTVTDDGSNTWSLVASGQVGATCLYTFMSRTTAAMTSVTASWAVPEECIGFVSEYSGVGDLIDTQVILTEGTPPSMNLPDGALIRGLLGVHVSNRTFEKNDVGVTSTDRNFWQGSQIEARRADAYASGNVSAAIGWDQTSGSSAYVAVINVAYTEAPLPPPPFFYRVEAGGSVTPVLLGVVTPTGVDTGT